MNTTYTYKPVTSIRRGRDLKERDELDYDTLEKAYKFADGWFEGQHDWAENGYKVSVSITPIEKTND